MQSVRIHIWSLHTALIIVFLNSPPLHGYININQYCKAFDVNFKPIICLLRNRTNDDASHYHPPPPHPPPPSPHPTEYPILHPFPGPVDYSDENDDECSCEVTCVPRIVNQRSFRNYLRRYKRSPTTSYKCRSCGTECPVSTTKRPMCNCVIPASKAQCNCSATCASFRLDPFHYANSRDDPDDANCILSVNALEDWRLGEERPPYVCECKRSKEAENTTKPDFICVCERVSSD